MNGLEPALSNHKICSEVEYVQLKGSKSKHLPLVRLRWTLTDVLDTGGYITTQAPACVACTKRFSLSTLGGCASMSRPVLNCDTLKRRPESFAFDHRYEEAQQLSWQAHIHQASCIAYSGKVSGKVLATLGIFRVGVHAQQC